MALGSWIGWDVGQGLKYGERTKLVIAVRTVCGEVEGRLCGVTVVGLSSGIVVVRSVVVRVVGIVGIVGIVG